MPAPSVQRSYYDAVISAVNAAGGVACRQLVPEYFTINPVDQSSLQQACLSIQQAKVYAALDFGAYSTYPALADCFAQMQVPLLAANGLFQAVQVAKDFPYLFSTTPTLDLLYKNTAFALEKLGDFDQAKGFHKLGVFYKSCVPGLLSQFSASLRQAGLTSNQIVSYDDGCPSSFFGSPANIEQAVLSFQQSGVTDVTELNAGADLNTFTKIAQQQGYHPQYLVPDDTFISTSTASGIGADYSNLDKAIAITSQRYGEPTTPGFPPAAATVKCNSIYAAHGVPINTYAGTPGVFAGFVCELVAFLQAGIANAPNLTRATFGAGVRNARSIDYAYPGGPDDYGGAGVATGGEFWRPTQFAASCGCWRVVSPNFESSF